MSAPIYNTAKGLLLRLADTTGPSHTCHMSIKTNLERNSKFPVLVLAQPYIHRQDDANTRYHFHPIRIRRTTLSGYVDMMLRKKPLYPSVSN